MAKDNHSFGVKLLLTITQPSWGYLLNGTTAILAIRRHYLFYSSEKFVCSCVIPPWICQKFTESLNSKRDTRTKYKQVKFYFELMEKEQPWSFCPLYITLHLSEWLTTHEFNTFPFSTSRSVLGFMDNRWHCSITNSFAGQWIHFRIPQDAQGNQKRFTWSGVMYQ